MPKKARGGSNTGNQKLNFPEVITTEQLMKHVNSLVGEKTEVQPEIFLTELQQLLHQSTTSPIPDKKTRGRPRDLEFWKEQAKLKKCPDQKKDGNMQNSRVKQDSVINEDFRGVLSSLTPKEIAQIDAEMGAEKVGLDETNRYLNF